MVIYINVSTWNVSSNLSSAFRRSGATSASCARTVWHADSIGSRDGTGNLLGGRPLDPLSYSRPFWRGIISFSFIVNAPEQGGEGITQRTPERSVIIRRQSGRTPSTTPSCDTSRHEGHLSQNQWSSYPEQDADGTGHANLAHAHHCHFIPGGLRRTAEQRSDQLLQNWGHVQCWRK